MQIKTINSLMKYLRDKHNLKIRGTKHKIILRNMGYYHGYKGYRYISSPHNKINFSNFDGLVAIVNFDSSLKSLLYAQIMQIETISKNIVLQILVETYKTNEFNNIFEKGMTDYRLSRNDDEYKKKMKHRLKVQNNIYSLISHSYSNNNKIVNHFYSSDRQVPIWGIFEIVTLGIFADLIKSLEFKTRRLIDKEMKINIAFDTNARFPEKIMYLIKPLRNSIAHNDIVFDVRFKDGKIDKTLCNYLEYELQCKNIDFNNITDYILLLAVLLKKYSINKTEINKFINNYENIIEDFRRKIPIHIYNQIIHSDTKNKLYFLKKYINAL